MPLKQLFLFVTILVLISLGVPSTSAAQCALQSSFDAWNEYAEKYRKITEAEENKQWETVVHLAEKSIGQVFDFQERTFLRYHLANGLIQSGKGKEAVPLLTDSTITSFNPEAGLEYFHVMINKLGLNFLGRFTDPMLALKHLDGLTPWMDEPDCDSLIDLMKIYRNAGELYYYRIGSNILAEDYFNRANKYWHEHSRDSSLLPPILYNLAVIKNISNQHGIALEYISSAIRIAERYPEKFSQGFRMSCLNIMGLIYYNWHKYEDFAAIMEELVILRDSDSDPYKYDHLIGEYWNLATAYREIREYSKSESALKMVRELSGLTQEHNDSSMIINYYNDLLNLQLLQGDLDSALSIIKLNKALIKRLSPDYNYNHYFFDRYHTDYWNKIGEYDKALKLLEVSLFDTDDAARRFLRTDLMLYAEVFIRAGDYHQKLYFQGKKSNGLRISLDRYISADSILHLVRTSNPWRPSSQDIAEHYRSLYEKMLFTIAELNQLEPKTKYLDDAFKVMERNKSLLLNEGRERNRYTSFADLGEDTIRILQDLETQIVNLNMSIRSKPEEEQTDDKLKLDRVQTEYIDFLMGINEGYVEHPTVTSLKDWQARTGKWNRAWIQYFTGDSLIFILGSHERELFYETVELTPDLNAAMDSVINHVRYYGALIGYPSFTRYARELYQTLIPVSIRDNNRIKNIIIIPDGNLSFFPFEVLLTSDDIPSSPDYSQLPYWVQNVSISYSMSASLWESNSTNVSGSLISTRYDGDYMGLPSSSLETEALASLWIGDFREISSKDDFFSNATTADVLHFATHAEAGLDELKENRIRLCDRFEDPSCTIEGYELLGLNLDRKLVILNACETSYGIEKKGEGVYSMSRDFAMAGVSTIVSNLWKVEDNAARELVVATITNWKREKQLSMALAEAKREMINEGSPEGAHPFFWAGTIIIGDSNLEVGMQLSRTARLAILILLVLFISLGVNRMRNRRN